MTGHHELAGGGWSLTALLCVDPVTLDTSLNSSCLFSLP